MLLQLILTIVLLLLFFMFAYFIYRRFYRNDTVLMENELTFQRPYHEYNYLQEYFNLPYNNSQKAVIEKVKWFFCDIPIIFICLKKNTERYQNIQHIISKYKLKNTHILSAIEYENLNFESTKSCRVDDEETSYLLNDLTTESRKELGCFLSHVKAIMYANRLEAPYVLIVEDDVTFDFVYYSPFSVMEFVQKIDMEKGYLSLYTNKPNYTTSLEELHEGNFSNGFYGAVACVYSKTILSQLSESFLHDGQVQIPKRKDCLYISDHYFPNQYPLYHVGHSIIMPNNLRLKSSLHTEKDHHHIQIQYQYLSHLYHRNQIKIPVKKTIYLYYGNPYLSYYKFTYPHFNIVRVRTYEKGLQMLKHHGGCFIFSMSSKVDIPQTLKSLYFSSSGCIYCVKNHPYLEWVQHKNYWNIENNPHLSLKAVANDYHFSYDGTFEHFAIIVPSYNNEKWVEKNLDSIYKQTYQNFHVYYMNDASEDNTLQQVTAFQQERGLKNMTIVDLKKRSYQAYARYMAYQKANPNDILVFLDGDDWLYDEHVLEKIKLQYDMGYQATYGKAIFYENGKELPEKFVHQEEYPMEIKIKGNYRTHKFFNVHLRTCRAQFIQSIPKSYLQNESKQWLQHSTDMAEWFYIMENVQGNVKFMDRINYVYNTDNSMLHSNSWFHNKDTQERQKTMDYIRSFRKKS